MSSKVVARRKVQSLVNKQSTLRRDGDSRPPASAMQGYADRFNDFGDTFRGAELWEEVIDHFGMLALALALLVGLMSPVAAAAQDGVANPFEQPWRYSQATVISAPAGWPEVPQGLWEMLSAQPGVLAEDPRQAAEKAKPLKIKRKYDVNLIGERGVGRGINFYSTDREITLGRGLSEEIERQTKLFEDAKVIEYVNRIVQNLVRNSDANVPFRVKIIDSDEVNAFALPGGFMYVNTGLILATENEAELAGVLAHEIAHVAARHATRNATKQDIWNLASIPLIFVGGPAGVAVRNIAQLAVPMSFMKFSRNAEREADLLGLEYQYAAGYDPAAMVGFFEKLKAQDKKKGNFIARAFSTHPMNDDRLRRSQQTIDTMLPERDQYLLTSSEFQEVKGRLQALIAGTRVSDTQDPGKPVLRKAK